MKPLEESELKTRIERLHRKASTLTEELKDEVDLLEKTLSFKEDYVGLRMRASELHRITLRLYTISNQIEALRDLEYPMVGTGPANDG